LCSYLDIDLTNICTCGYVYKLTENFIIIGSLIDAEKKKDWKLEVWLSELLSIDKKSQNKMKPTIDGNKLRKF